MSPSAAKTAPPHRNRHPLRRVDRRFGGRATRGHEPAANISQDPDAVLRRRLCQYATELPQRGFGLLTTTVLAARADPQSEDISAAGVTKARSCRGGSEWQLSVVLLCSLSKASCPVDVASATRRSSCADAYSNSPQSTQFRYRTFRARSTPTGPEILVSELIVKSDPGPAQVNRPSHPRTPLHKSGSVLRVRPGPISTPFRSRSHWCCADGASPS
ncbi:hypothetical protein ACVWWN_000737 [Mycobacterium sp. URHB0021]|jgi:hypothetical protein